MLKRILKKKKRCVVKSLFSRNELKLKVVQSFSRNKELSGLERVSFFIKNNDCFDGKGFFFQLPEVIMFFYRES